MINASIVFLTVGAAAFLNRFRGGGFGAEHLPSRPLFYVAPLMGALSWANHHDWKLALIMAATYLVWALPAWGQWYDLGHVDNYRDPKAWEKLLNRFAHNNESLAFFLRQLIIVPGFGLAAWLQGGFMPVAVGLMLPVLIVLCYAAAWAANDMKKTTQPIMWAEIAAGAFWGAALVVVA